MAPSMPNAIHCQESQGKTDIEIMAVIPYANPDCIFALQSWRTPWQLSLLLRDHRMPETARVSSSAPVAIIGHGYTLPGVCSPQAMAEVLLEGKRTYEQLPPERIPREIYLDPAAHAGMPKIYTALGGSIPCGEPRGDPLPGIHRLVVDAVQRALGSAKRAPSALRGQPVPIFLAHSRGGGHGLYDAAVMSVAHRLLPYLVHSAHPHEFTVAELSAIADQVRRQ